MPITLTPPATQSEIDLAITTLRGNGCEGITGDMIIAAVAEQRIIDASAGANMLDKSKWTGPDSVTPDSIPTLDLAASLIAGLTDDDIQAKAEGRTVADLLAGIAAIKQLLRDLVSASDANDEGSVLNCIEDARELLAETDATA